MPKNYPAAWPMARELTEHEKGIQEFVREHGLCGAVCDNGESLCILPPDHDGEHGGDERRDDGT